MSQPAPFDEIRALTQELRTSSSLYWADLRDLPTRRGVTVDAAVLVDRSVDEDLDFLTLVLEESRAVEIEYVDRHYAPGRRPEIRTWLDVAPGTPEWSLYCDPIELALARRAEI